MGRRLRTTGTLGLWMNGARSGTRQPGNRMRWRHASIYLDRAQSVGRPLSLSLPFTPGNAPHRGEKVRA